MIHAYKVDTLWIYQIIFRLLFYYLYLTRNGIDLKYHDTFLKDR